jgi:L-rhamnose mutarotase
MPRHILLIDLIDDAAAIARYERWHAAAAVPAAVCAHIRASGIVAMEIYRSGHRLVMVMETGDDYDPARAESAAVGEWERKMNSVQQPLPWADPRAKWTPAAQIFSLAEQP